MWFKVWIALAISLGPYLYYSHKIHEYGIANQPEGFGFPAYSELWKVVGFTAVYQLFGIIVKRITTPIFDPLMKS